MLRYSFLPAVIYPVLFLYVYNIRQSSFFSALKILLLCVALFSGLFLLLKKLRYNTNSSSFIATVTAVIFFSYGHFFTYLRDLVRQCINRFDFAPRVAILGWAETILHIFLSILSVGIIIAVSRTLRRSDFSVREKPLKAFSIIFISLIILTGFDLLKSVNTYLSPPEKIQPRETFAPSDLPQNPPDIYYIILDGFTRPDVMEKVYKVNLDDFTSILKKMGFYIAPESKSNYSQTILSLSSSLNMNYHDENLDPELKYKYYVKEIQDNKVVSFLQEKGYQYIHLSSIWSPTLTNPNSDIEISYPQWFISDEFYRTFFSTTWFRIFDFLMGANIAKVHLYNFNQLQSIASEISSPKFVFAHFVLPHSPYVFDKNGNIKSKINMVNMWEKENNVWNDANGYREQAIFTAKATLISVANILKKSQSKPIIIIQADHGVNLVYSDDKNLPYRNAAIYIRHSILNAYLFPDHDYSVLTPDISPVNSFRVIFNKYFGAQFDILPNNSYYTGS